MWSGPVVACILLREIRRINLFTLVGYGKAASLTFIFGLNKDGSLSGSEKSCMHDSRVLFSCHVFIIVGFEHCIWYRSGYGEINMQAFHIIQVWGFLKFIRNYWYNKDQVLNLHFTLKFCNFFYFKTNKNKICATHYHT